MSARRSRSPVAVRRAIPEKLARMRKHVLESLLARGVPLDAAERISAATVNKHRAKLAREGRGPRLVGRGGSRRQWYPGKRVKTGKKRARGAKAVHYCIAHRRRFKTRAALKSHYRGLAHRRRSRW